MLGFMRYLFGLIFVAKFSSGGEKLSCEVHTENNKIIDLKISKLRNPAARVLEGFNSNSALECQKECCGNSNCTLFVYHQRKEKKYSCFLVSCSPKENCDYQQLNGSLLGYVTRAPRLAQETGVMNDIVSRPTASSVPNTRIQSTFTPSPKVISSPRTARVASATPSPKGLSSPTTARVSSSTSKSSTPTEPHRTPVTPKGSLLYQSSLPVSVALSSHFSVSVGTLPNASPDGLKVFLVTQPSTKVIKLPYSMLTHSTVMVRPLSITPPAVILESFPSLSKKIVVSGMTLASPLSVGLFSTEVSSSTCSSLSHLSSPSIIPTVPTETNFPVKSSISGIKSENGSFSTLSPAMISVTTSVEANKNSTTHDDHRKKVPTTADQHTTVASLVIALCFGILFLFAVVVLIGRPWWDAYHRPRYSKVDYLMNGL